MDKLFVEVHGKNGAWYTVMSQHLRPMDPTRPAKVKLQPKTTHCEHISELKELKCSAVTRGKDGEEREKKKRRKNIEKLKFFPSSKFWCSVMASCS